MIFRLFVLASLVLFNESLAAQEEVRIVYLGIDGDTYYEPQVSYTGLSLKDRLRPIDGARLGMKGTRVLGRALGLSFELDEQILPPEESVLAAAQKAQKDGAVALLLDLPETEMQEILSSDLEGLLLFNIRHRKNLWRGKECVANLLHTLPSQSMLTDALAQHLRFQNWPKILLLHGDTEADVTEADAIVASAQKFGLDVVAREEFQLTNDPRRRDFSNIRLMTGKHDYDVIWIADENGEFGRYVPFATAKPRPIVGSEGLTANAWHWTLERYGAPQLNQRFRRKSKRNMSSEDWASWAAVKAVLAAVTEAGSGNKEDILRAIRSPDLIVDLYKGLRGSFRSWNGQLRQPILLASHNAVISLAPFDGFEHQRDQQDTLGVDEPETLCVL
ncbi:MAG: amino acid ABC transporter substrate-binding protein [Stappiaceae bacterium]